MWCADKQSLLQRQQLPIGNLFIKNLPKSIDHQSLYDLFSLFGNILSCKIVLETETGLSKGFGYVHYDTIEAANEAIVKMNGQLVEDSCIEVSHFRTRQERALLKQQQQQQKKQQQESLSDSEQQWKKLYVKQFPLSWTEEDLRELFAAYGQVMSVKISNGSETSTSAIENKGFGFVEMDSHEHAIKVIEKLHGKALIDATGRDPNTYVLYVSPIQSKQERELMKQMQQWEWQQQQELEMQMQQQCNLLVKNLSDYMTHDRLFHLFAPYGQVTSAKVEIDKATGSSKGFGFVCLSSPEEAWFAMSQMNGQMLAGKPLKISIHQPREQRLQQQFGMAMFPSAYPSMVMPAPVAVPAPILAPYSYPAMSAPPVVLQTAPWMMPVPMAPIIQLPPLQYEYPSWANEYGVYGQA
jgi:polyadenylate-binding protein